MEPSGSYNGLSGSIIRRPSTHRPLPPPPVPPKEHLPRTSFAGQAPATQPSALQDQSALFYQYTRQPPARAQTSLAYYPRSASRAVAPAPNRSQTPDSTDARGRRLTLQIPHHVWQKDAAVEPKSAILYCSSATVPGPAPVTPVGPLSAGPRVISRMNSRRSAIPERRRPQSESPAPSLGSTGTSEEDAASTGSSSSPSTPQLGYADEFNVQQLAPAAQMVLAGLNRSVNSPSDMIGSTVVSPPVMATRAGPTHSTTSSEATVTGAFFGANDEVEVDIQSAFQSSASACESEDSEQVTDLEMDDVSDDSDEDACSSITEFPTANLDIFGPENPALAARRRRAMNQHDRTSSPYKSNRLQIVPPPPQLPSLGLSSFDQPPTPHREPDTGTAMEFYGVPWDRKRQQIATPIDDKEPTLEGSKDKSAASHPSTLKKAGAEGAAGVASPIEPIPSLGPELIFDRSGMLISESSLWLYDSNRPANSASQSSATIPVPHPPVPNTSAASLSGTPPSSMFSQQSLKPSGSLRSPFRSRLPERAATATSSDFSTIPIPPILPSRPARFSMQQPLKSPTKLQIDTSVGTPPSLNLNSKQFHLESPFVETPSRNLPSGVILPNRQDSLRYATPTRTKGPTIGKELPATPLERMAEEISASPSKTAAPATPLLTTPSLSTPGPLVRSNTVPLPTINESSALAVTTKSMSPEPVHDPVFFQAFKHLREICKPDKRPSDGLPPPTPALVHGKARDEAMRLSRSCLTARHRDILAGHVSFNLTKEETKRYDPQQKPNEKDDEYRCRLLFVQAEKERRAMELLKIPMWVLEATQALNGGHLLFSPARRDLQSSFHRWTEENQQRADEPQSAATDSAPAFLQVNRENVRTILDLGGRPTFDWAWEISLQYPNARVFTVTVSPKGSTSPTSDMSAFEGDPETVTGPHNHIEIKTRNLWTLPFPSNTIDLVSARSLYMILKAANTRALHTIEEESPSAGQIIKDEYERTLTEIYRVLKPGGYVEFSLLDADVLGGGDRTQELSVAFCNYLKKSEYDPVPTKSFIKHLRAAGFDRINRSWMILPMCGVGCPVTGDSAEVRLSKYLKSKQEFKSSVSQTPPAVAPLSATSTESESPFPPRSVVQKIRSFGKLKEHSRTGSGKWAGRTASSSSIGSSAGLLAGSSLGASSSASSISSNTVPFSSHLGHQASGSIWSLLSSSSATARASSIEDARTPSPVGDGEGRSRRRSMALSSIAATPGGESAASTTAATPRASQSAEGSPTTASATPEGGVGATSPESQAPPGSGTTASASYATGMVGAWAWEQWMLRVHAHAGMGLQSETVLLRQISDALDEGARTGAAWRYLTGWARKEA